MSNTEYEHGLKLLRTLEIAIEQLPKGGKGRRMAKNWIKWFKVCPHCGELTNLTIWTGKDRLWHCLKCRRAFV